MNSGISKKNQYFLERLCTLVVAYPYIGYTQVHMITMSLYITATNRLGLAISLNNICTDAIQPEILTYKPSILKQSL